VKSFPSALLALLALSCAVPSRPSSVPVEGSKPPDPVTSTAPIRNPQRAPDPPADEAGSGSQGICASGWVVERQKEAEREGFRFALLSGTSFQEGKRSYTLGLRTPDDPEAGYVTLLCFEVGDGAPPRRISSERFGTLAMSMLEEGRRAPSDCMAPEMRPWFHVTVVDLDGDGSKEIVVESNSVGTCSACLSDVCVYKIKGKSLTEILCEPYDDIAFDDGKGLVVEAHESDENGPVGPTRKTFFMTPEQP